jgi:pre-mRNA-processing factor 19
LAELTCCQFHPDGHLIALGGADKEIKMLDVTTGAIAATFATADGAPCSLSFSENGTWLASASAGSGSVAVWDLRKAAVIKTLEFGGAGVRAVAWDWSAQYLAVVAGGALNVVMYSKSGKKWSELLKRAVVARRVAWDPSGRGLAVDGEDGVVEFVVEEEE